MPAQLEQAFAYAEPLEVVIQQSFKLLRSLGAQRIRVDRSGRHAVVNMLTARRLPYTIPARSAHRIVAKT